MLLLAKILWKDMMCKASKWTSIKVTFGTIDVVCFMITWLGGVVLLKKKNLSVLINFQTIVSSACIIAEHNIVYSSWSCMYVNIIHDDKWTKSASEQSEVKHTLLDLSSGFFFCIPACRSNGTLRHIKSNKRWQAVYAIFTTAIIAFACGKKTTTTTDTDIDYSYSLSLSLEIKISLLLW